MQLLCESFEKNQKTILRNLDQKDINNNKKNLEG